MRGLSWVPSLLTRRLASQPEMRLEMWLEMGWPIETRPHPPTISVPDGYLLRQFLPSADVSHYTALMLDNGLEPPPLDDWATRILPDGFFVLYRHEARRIVAAGFAAHLPTKKYPRDYNIGGTIGGIVVDPDHQRKGLGRVIASAVTARLLRAVHLTLHLTDDHPLPAIALYRSIGWEPFRSDPNADARWARILESLSTLDTLGTNANAHR